MKSTAELIIVCTISGATSYPGRALVWSTRAYTADAGRKGARERLRRRLFAIVFAQEELKQEWRRASSSADRSVTGRHSTALAGRAVSLQPGQ